MTHSLELTVPYFPGFYESPLSQMLDYEEERFCEYEAERQTEVAFYPETYQPEYLRLDSSEISECLNSAMDYRKANHAITLDWIIALDDVLMEALDFPANSLKFSAMTSPKYYNFETDRAFASISPKTAKRLFAISKADKHEKLAQVIKGSFTSYDGFYSFYSNELTDWLDKPLADWDCNELGTLLAAALLTVGIGRDAGSDSWHGSLESQLSQLVAEESYQYLDAAVDWPKYERLVQDIRDEKQAEYLDEQGLDASELPAHRCPLTLDMFSDIRA